jgi:hypothetical protein
MNEESNEAEIKVYSGFGDAAKRPAFHAESSDCVRGVWAASGQLGELLSARGIQVEWL